MMTTKDLQLAVFEVGTLLDPESQEICKLGKKACCRDLSLVQFTGYLMEGEGLSKSRLHVSKCPEVGVVRGCMK